MLGDVGDHALRERLRNLRRQGLRHLQLRHVRGEVRDVVLLQEGFDPATCEHDGVLGRRVVALLLVRVAHELIQRGHVERLQNEAVNLLLAVQLGRAVG